MGPKMLAVAAVLAAAIASDAMAVTPLITNRRDQDMSGFHMNSYVQLSRDGRHIRGTTQIVSHTALAGHCGRAVFTLLAEDGEILDVIHGDRYCVGATRVPWDGATERNEDFSRRVDPRARGRVARITITHQERPRTPEEQVRRGRTLAESVGHGGPK
jgi:hypothetical protein